MPNTTKHSESDLIGRALAGEHLAFERLAERHRATVLALAKRALDNWDDAQDVAQEAFMHVHLQLPKLRDRSSFAARLRCVTLSLCADYRRRRGTRGLGEPIHALTEAAEEQDHASALAIRKALSHLSDDHRTVVLLHYLGGWPLTEVAGLTEVPRGENLLLWALGGTPHRIRLATERAFEAIDKLQSITAELQAVPVGAALERRDLADEVAILTVDDRWNADQWLSEEGADRTKWLADPWFVAALSKVSVAIDDIREPLVYTHYGHFFPLSYRIAAGPDPFDQPSGAPGDPAYAKNPLAEFVSPFGHYGDPLLGLAMVWVYDCHPFVHTGFVEQFLFRRGTSRRDFGPRLALKALQMIARDLSIARPAEGAGYWDGLHGWVEQGLCWM